MTQLTSNFDDQSGFRYIDLHIWIFFLTATEARQRFLKLLAEVKGGERIIITHRGKPAAVVIDFERLQLLTELARLWQDPQSLSHIRAAHEIFAPAEYIAQEVFPR